ncbi:UDP-4-amino-4,6-dideoxy-N-acetyl-beta-L-altrosamine transaminase [Helicobacter sp. 23-1046]
MKVYPYSTQLIESDDRESVCRALKSSHLTQGEITKRFEDALAQFVGARYALVLNSATSALYATFFALKAKYWARDSHIYAITTPITFVATSNMMLQNGITPIFANIKENGNIDSQSIKEILQSHPKKDMIKMIVSVDYGGQSVDCDEIACIAKEHNLIWVSDSSHSFGGSYKGRKIGGIADVSIFSFHAIKPITTAEGGAIMTNDEEIYAFASKILNHGVIKGEAWEYDCTHSGFNFRLSEIGAALGLSQLTKIQSFLSRRGEIAKFYDEVFANNEFFDTMARDSHIMSSHHLYPIFLRPDLAQRKKEIFASLHKNGMLVQVHYRPICQFSLYKQLCQKDFLVSKEVRECADRFYNAELSIPCAQSMSMQDAKIVSEVIMEVFKSVAS